MPNTAATIFQAPRFAVASSSLPLEHRYAINESIRSLSQARKCAVLLFGFVHSCSVVLKMSFRVSLSSAQSLFKVTGYDREIFAIRFVVHLHDPFLATKAVTAHELVIPIASF